MKFIKIDLRKDDPIFSLPPERHLPVPWFKNLTKASRKRGPIIRGKTRRDVK